MSASSVTIRVDSAMKQAATEVAEYYGLDLSSVTRAFYSQMIREHRIPLTLECTDPNQDSLESIAEAQELIASKHPGYDSLDAMFEAMGV